MRHPVLRCKLSSVYSWLFLLVICGLVAVLADIPCAVILATPISIALVVVQSVSL